MSSDSQFFDNLRKVINLVDQLRDLGLHNYISLPRIAVLGSQSSGKSSLLEQIVGLDFLPRGSGVVTRRPLELRLINTKDLKTPYGKFEEIPNKEFTDFQLIKKTIEELTDKVAGTKKGIVDKPIILTVHSPTCPDLTLIDLPGITRISIESQGENIEKITKDMAQRYCSDPKTIIMCVTPANTDLSTSDGLKMARELDPNGDRTIGVLTKIDIMDHGTNARDMLLGKVIPLRLGYVGIKNRSQKDINENQTVQYSLEQEKKFFSSHTVYSTLQPGLVGTSSLNDKLTKILFKHIRNFMPELLQELTQQIKEKQIRLAQLGTALPESDSEKLHFLWRIINDFVTAYKSQMSGQYDKNAKFEKNQIPPGSEIRQTLSSLYSEYNNEDNIYRLFPDSEIKKAMLYHQGDSIPGFPSIDAFLAIITPKLKDLKQPAMVTIREVYETLEEVAVRILKILLEKAPSVKDEIQEQIIKHIQNQQTSTEAIVNDLLDTEINYIFTNNESYLNKQELPKKINTGNEQQRDTSSILSSELQNRLCQYFKLVIRNVRDSIPKSIGYFLVKKTIDKMQFVLFDTIKRKEELYKLMQEPVHIVEERKELQKAIRTFQNAEKIIKKDPELTIYGHQRQDSKNEKSEQSKIQNIPQKQQQQSQKNISDSQYNDLFGIERKTNNQPSNNSSAGNSNPSTTRSTGINNMFPSANNNTQPPQKNPQTNNMFPNNNSNPDQRNQQFQQQQQGMGNNLNNNSDSGNNLKSANNMIPNQQQRSNYINQIGSKPQSQNDLSNPQKPVNQPPQQQQSTQQQVDPLQNQRQQPPVQKKKFWDF